MREQCIQFHSLIQTNYLWRPAKSPQAPLVILIHGFNSSAQKMWDRLADQVPNDCHLLAPNAPYPLPNRHEDTWRVGYSWYFFDNLTNNYLIGYEVAQHFMQNLCSELGLADHAKTLIGFSQGGYAAPHMAETLSGVHHVIGIGCRFKIKQPRWPDNLLIEGVHGELDDLVQWSGAQESFAALPERHKGRLQGFPKAGHKPTSPMLDTVGTWLRERLEQNP